MHALELAVLRFAQVEAGEHAPDRDRQIAHQRLLDLAEPSDEPGHQPPGNAICEQKVHVFLGGDFQQLRSNCHIAAACMGYIPILWNCTARALRFMQPEPPRWPPRWSSSRPG